MKRNNRETRDKDGKRSNQWGPEALSLVEVKVGEERGSAEMNGVLIWIRGGMACYLGLEGDPAPSPALCWPMGRAKPLNRVGVAHGMRGWGAGGGGNESSPAIHSRSTQKTAPRGRRRINLRSMDHTWGEPRGGSKGMEKNSNRNEGRVRQDKPPKQPRGSSGGKGRWVREVGWSI